MSNASIGYLAKIQHSATSGGTYVDLVSEPTMVSIPSVEISEIDATHLQSPNRYKEKIPGMYTLSPESYEANYVKDDYLALKGIEGEVRYFKITSGDPDGAGPMAALTVTFPGYVHRVKVDFSAEDLNKLTWEIVPNGGEPVNA